MTDKQFLALLTAILLIGKNLSGDAQVAQAADFAKLIVKETQ
jgi:hypothetical protein